MSRRKTLEKLFISKVRIKALKFFMLHPDEEIHLRACVREFHEEINAVRRELQRLEAVKLVTTEKKGNRKYFLTNKNHPYFNELLPIFHKAYGLGGDIANNAEQLGNVKFALLTNSYTKNTRQSTYVVDMMIVGDINLTELASIVSKYEQQSGREIHYTVMKSNEFELRKRRRDNFVIDILLQPKVMLIGSEEMLVANAS